MDNSWYEPERDDRRRHAGHDSRGQDSRSQGGRNHRHGSRQRRSPWELFLNGDTSALPATPQAWLQEMLGLANPEPPRPRGPRVRRGDVRTAVLDVLHDAHLDEVSLNGYQVIQQIAERSNEEWRPSPGSVYPTISQLQDEGLVLSDEAAGRRALSLSPEGIAWAEANEAERRAVWAPFDGDHRRPRAAYSRPRGAAGPDGAGSDDGGQPGEAPTSEQARRAEEAESLGAGFRTEMTQVLGAAWQLLSQGSSAQRRAALGVLAETRRSLYSILAEGREPGAR